MTAQTNQENTDVVKAEVIYESAKGLQVTDQGGLPFQVHLPNPDRNGYFTLDKDGVTFGSLFMDVRQDSVESYGLTDAILIAIVKRRYERMAVAMPDLQNVVTQLDKVLETLSLVERTMLEVPVASEETTTVVPPAAAE